MRFRDRRRRRRLFICWLIKLLVARARPPLTLQETLETDYSLPSGHVTGTVALVGIIAALVVGAVVAGALLGTLAVTIGATTLRALTVDSPRQPESVASVDEARV